MKEGWHWLWFFSWPPPVPGWLSLLTHRVQRLAGEEVFTASLAPLCSLWALTPTAPCPAQSCPKQFL